MSQGRRNAASPQTGMLRVSGNSVCDTENLIRRWPEMKDVDHALIKTQHRENFKSGLNHPLAEPVRQLLFIQRPAGDRPHRMDGIDFRKLQVNIVVSQKYPGNHPSSALVAVAETVMPCISRRQRQLLRLGQGRLQCVLVAHPIQSTVTR